MTSASQVQLFVLQQLILISPSQFALIIIIKNLNCWRLPKWFPLEDKRAIPLAHLYRWKKSNFGQAYGIKEWCYYQGNILRNTLIENLGIYLGTWWEHIGNPQKKIQQGVCHIVTLPFTFKKYLKWQKKNYGNSNISPCKNTIFKKKLL